MKIKLSHLYEGRNSLIARVKETDRPIHRKTAKDGQITCVAIDTVGCITPYCDYFRGTTAETVSCEVILKRKLPYKRRRR